MLVTFPFFIHGRHGPCHFLFCCAQTQYLILLKITLHIAILMNWSCHVRWGQLSTLGLGHNFQVCEFTMEGSVNQNNVHADIAQSTSRQNSEWTSCSPKCTISGHLKVHLIWAPAFTNKNILYFGNIFKRRWNYIWRITELIPYNMKSLPFIV